MMMNGYDKEEALGYILPRIDRKAHRALEERIDALISQAIDADMAYMFESGVLDEEGNAGESYYDDDEAIEFMLDDLTARNALSAEETAQVAALLDDYMELQQDFLESIGLVDWE